MRNIAWKNVHNNASSSLLVRNLMFVPTIRTNKWLSARETGKLANPNQAGISCIQRVQEGDFTHNVYGEQP